MPRSSRAARAGLLAAQQAAPRNPWEGLRAQAGEGQGAMLETSVCKVQAARAAGEHSLQGEVGSQSGVWVGFEVLVPRRRPPAGPPGHREGTAEALSSQRAMVAGFQGWTGPPRAREQWSKALPRPLAGPVLLE